MRLDIMMINIAFAIATGGIILFYLKINKTQYEKNRAFLFIIAFGFINGFLSTKVSTLGDFFNVIKPLFLVVCCIALIKYLLNLNLKTSIMSFVLIGIGMGIGNAFTILVMSPFFKDFTTEVITSNTLLYTLSNIITAMITFFIILLIKPMLQFFKNIIESKEMIVAFVFTIVIITANTAMFYFIAGYNFTIFLLITLMSVVYGGYIIFNGIVLYRRELQKNEQQQQEFYNKSLENTLFNLRRFKHDWGNNIAVINTMIAMKKYEEVKSYLHEIIEFNDKSNNTLIYNIKNAGLFGIISAKQSMAIDRGIDIEISGIGEIGEIPGIKISELCEVLGILLDNAIEESEKIHEKVELTYSSSEEFIEICIRNKCKESIDLDMLEKRSVKGPDRGNGLKIVKQIVEKYKNVENFHSYKADSRIFEQLLIIEKGP